MSGSRAAPISIDITNIVWAHYNPPEAKPYQCKKTWVRTGTNLVEERPDTLWQQHHVRHQENLNKGYQSVQWEPYRSLGSEVKIDPYELMVTKIADSLDKEVWKVQYKQIHDDKSERRKRVNNSQLFTPVKPITVSTSPKPMESERCYKPNEAFKKVKRHLKSTTKLQTRIRSGQSFEEHLRQQQALHKQNENDINRNKGMCLMSLTDLEVGHGQLTTHSESDFGQYQEIPVNDAKKRQDHNGNQPHSEKKERLRRDQLQYLEALFKVIVSLHNMKNKDLKSKVPLSRNAVELLAKEDKLHNAFCGVDSKLHCGAGQFLSSFQLKSTTTMDSVGRSGTTLYPPPSPRKIDTSNVTSRLAFGSAGQFLSSFQLKSTTTVDSVGRSGTTLYPPPSPRKIDTFNVTSRLAFGRKCVKVHSESLHTVIKDKTSEYQVENWEDLVGLGDKTHAQSQSPAWHKKSSGSRKNLGDSFRAQHQSEITFAALPSISHLVKDNVRQTVKKTVPIWQLVLNEKCPKDPTRKEKQPLDVNNLVNDSRQKLRKVRASLQQELETAYDKYEREKMLNFKCKYNTFEKLSVSYEAQHRKMKMAVDNMTRNFNVDHPSEWYDEVREKTFKITGSDDEEINRILDKINKCSTMDSKSIPHAKAKLCLLVMSLPSYEILTLSMQNAIKYVLEAILLGDLGMFIEWLEHRRVPLVIEKGS